MTAARVLVGIATAAFASSCDAIRWHAATAPVRHAAIRQAPAAAAPIDQPRPAADARSRRASIAAGPRATRRAVDYDWDVRPILAEHCFRCHGADERARRAGLRLDMPESAYGALGGDASRHAIVPGRPDESELVRRVSATAPSVRMPPVNGGTPLTPSEVDVMRRWIDAGAVYRPHWAYGPPRKPPVPQISGAPRRRSEIDRFIVDRLVSRGLALSPEADRETLINRVSLTLTGLPPSLEQVDAFVNDRGANAYETVVDRLLASPAYGEHMAAQWLDLARYAETDGFLDDSHNRLLWPYRDWVIGAFNRNMPFDTFGTLQLAGDLLPDATPDQILPTAFVRLGRRNTENGVIDEEYRVEYVLERTNTIGTAFLGLTVGCARCHDHKYDPISQHDYYALTAFFNNTEEPGFYPQGVFGVTPGPTLDWPAADALVRTRVAATAVQVQEQRLAAEHATAERELASRADALASDAAALTASLATSIERGLAGYYPFESTEPIPDDRLPKRRERFRRPAPPVLNPETFPPAPAAAAPVVQPLPAGLVRDALVWSPSPAAGVGPAVLEAPIFGPGIKGRALFFDDTNRGVCDARVGDFDRTRPFSLDLWVLAPKQYADSTVLNHREVENNGGVGYQLQLQDNHVRFEMLHARWGNALALVTAAPIPVNRWTHLTVTYDGSSRAAGVRMYVDGITAAVDVLADNLRRTILPNGGGANGDEFLGLAFGKRFRMTTLQGGAIDELRVYDRELAAIEVRYLDATTRGGAAAPETASAVLPWLVSADALVDATARSLAAAREAQNQLASRIPQLMVMGDLPTPRPAYILRRGNYADHGSAVEAQGLARILPWKASMPRNRLGLAQWLFDPDNPLTARVAVNHVWQMHFGRGLVETSEDFGLQGAPPTYPELLDWLAVTFRESGWDLKKLNKAIVMSAAYRQRSTTSAQAREADPQDRWLEHYPRTRMSAEAVRDHALAAAGLLVTTIGGASVHPYQPDGVWFGSGFWTYPASDKVPAAEHHRRSVYTYVKRNGPHPAMTIFDMPDRGASVSRRATSNTPLQALVLLNDPQYIEAYRALAARASSAGAEAAAQVVAVFRLATRRHPTAAEMERLTAYYDLQLRRYTDDPAAADALLRIGVTKSDDRFDHVRLAALSSVAAVVMNTPDAYTIH